MTKTITIAVIALVAVVMGMSSIVPALAVPVLNPANGHHYELISTTLSWTDAKSEAEASIFQGVNGHLVTITSGSEDAFVEGLVTDDKRVWIGLTDEVSEGTFEWVTGEPVTYTNWLTGEPNDANGLEDFVELLSEPPFNGVWNDLPNVWSLNNGYVVEYDTDPVHSGMFDILEEILDEVKAIWDAIQDEVIPLLEGIDTTVNNIEPSSVRDNLFVTDVHLKDGQVMVLLDNAGIGGSSDVEVTWRLDETKCQLLYTLTDVAAGLTLTQFVDGGELGGNPAHEDLSGVEAIALTTQDKKNCHVNPTQGEYIGISTIGSTP